MMSSYTVSEANKGGNVRIIEAISCNHYCNGIAISARYCERVFVALGIQRAPYCHLWPAPLYTIFSTLSHKHHGFRKKKVIDNKSVFQFSLQICLKHFLFEEELSEIWSKFYSFPHVMCPILLSGFDETWNLSAYFRKYVLNFMNVCLVGAELFHADRWTDMTKLKVAFCDFAKAPKNLCNIHKFG